MILPEDLSPVQAGPGMLALGVAWAQHRKGEGSYGHAWLGWSKDVGEFKEVGSFAMDM